jgi:hypothetical protein
MTAQNNHQYDDSDHSSEDSNGTSMLQNKTVYKLYMLCMYS